VRCVGLCLLASTGCASIFGLDSPTARDDAGDAGGSKDGGDAPAAPVCGSDNFDDNVLNASLWVQFVEGMDTVTETNQRLEMMLDNNPGSAYCGIDAKKPLDADETGVQVEVVQWSEDTTSETALVLFVNGGNQLIFTKDESTLRTIVKTNGANMSHMQPFDPATRFLRIERDANNKVTFSTSTDGSSWLRSWETNASFANQNLKPELYAGHYQQAPAATIIFDNFAILSPRCP